MRRILTWGLGLLLVVSVLATGAYVATHHYSPGRILYKRLKAPSRYTFDEINPRFLKTDPAALIAITDAAAAARLRRRIATTIWGAGGRPNDRLPDTRTSIEPPFGLEDLANSAGVERWSIGLQYGYRPSFYVFRPARPGIGTPVIYQHGYAGTIYQARAIIAHFLNEGRVVVAHNFPGYGENRLGLIDHPRFGRVTLGLDRILTYEAHALRYYFEPVIVSINAALAETGARSVDMVGFSAGGWVTTIAAAIDERIRASASVAGVLPLYLADRSPPPQFYFPLIQTANYLEIFVLAASGADRRYLQIFNRYDRCCSRNTKGKLYEAAVADAAAAAGDGRFAVLIDETHADHKVSDWALAHVAAWLAPRPPATEPREGNAQ